MKKYIVITISSLLIAGIALGETSPYSVSAAHGNVIISGNVYFQPRNWNAQLQNWRRGKEIQIELIEKDIYGNTTSLEKIYTNSQGHFEFSSRENWWSDNRQLNIYYVIRTTYPETDVTDISKAIYGFQSGTYFLNRDGNWIIDFYISNSWDSYQALWIFDDLRNAWDFVYTHNNYIDPGTATVLWENDMPCFPTVIPGWDRNCVPFTYGGPLLSHFIFISQNYISSQDTVLHELGHLYMVNANGYWYTGCQVHYMFTISDINCGWAEGWADFFPLAVNNDSCYDSLPNSCQGQADNQYYDLEAHSRFDRDRTTFPWGANVEGRVAAALYDLYDNHPDGLDSIHADFAPIAHIALGGSQIQTFPYFWLNWMNSSGQDIFRSGVTLWWNTIDYVIPRQVNLPIIRR